MQRMIVLGLLLLVTCFVNLEARGQSGGNTGQAGAAQAVPYYVDPSRFQYNRPSSRVFGGATGSAGVETPRNIQINVPPGFYYYGYRWCPPYCGFGHYGYPMYYYPRVRVIAPGVTEHVGPFIPVR